MKKKEIRMKKKRQYDSARGLLRTVSHIPRKFCAGFENRERLESGPGVVSFDLLQKGFLR